MTEDPERHMLLELERLLEQAPELPAQITPDQVAGIGRDAGLTEQPSYRIFSRLHEQRKLIGEATTKDEPPGWRVYWLRDVRL